MEKFIITIEKAVSFEETTDVYEATNGKRYYSTYGIPADTQYTTKSVKTGKTGWNKSDVYMQEVDALSLSGVIKAINDIK